MSKVLIVGGGAAGMFASIIAARNGHEVQVFEKNEKLGKKLFITGKGRCNLTNACDMEQLFASVVSNSRFLYSSFYGYTNQQVMLFFEKLGLHTKIERGDRVFPASDHSSDVIKVMEREMKRLGVVVHFHTQVIKVGNQRGKFEKITLADGQNVYGDACIIATGGLSYPSTGSTGDGYRFAEENGHQVTECLPSLVPMEVREPWAGQLQGLSLRNVTITIYQGKKQIFQEFGEMLFTHYGVSGPLILSASSYVGRQLKNQELRLEIDLKPALGTEQLDQRVLRDFGANPNKQFQNVVSGLFPSKLTPVMVGLSGIDPQKKVNMISRDERLSLVHLIKHLSMTITGLRSYDEAIITKGGVKTKEIHPGTMESKYVEGLYFAGEVLDVDALTGGFNLQIAWSTAYAAGNNIRQV